MTYSSQNVNTHFLFAVSLLGLVAPAWWKYQHRIFNALVPHGVIYEQNLQQLIYSVVFLNNKNT
jgi:hypothetical protein